MFRYLHYDVFTDKPLTGSQLAVFTDPAHLAAEDMLRITREMNFSECTFILPSEQAGTDVRLRIFTRSRTSRSAAPACGWGTDGSRRSDHGLRARLLTPCLGRRILVVDPVRPERT
jgi:trans-2,3-dihydro-3-hydroxyanthranilate isomerase